MMLRPLAALTVLTFFVNSTAVAASFEADVAPIFAKKCAGTDVGFGHLVVNSNDMKAP